MQSVPSQRCGLFGQETCLVRFHTYLRGQHTPTRYIKASSAAEGSAKKLHQRAAPARWNKLPWPSRLLKAGTTQQVASRPADEPISLHGCCV